MVVLPKIRSTLDRGPLMWKMLQHLHINQNPMMMTMMMMMMTMMMMMMMMSTPWECEKLSYLSWSENIGLLVSAWAATTTCFNSCSLSLSTFFLSKSTIRSLFLSSWVSTRGNTASISSLQNKSRCLPLTLCMLGKFACLLPSAYFFFKINFSKILSGKQSVSNSLDPDQAQLFAKVISRRN